MATQVQVDPEATISTSTSDNPNPYSMAVESDGKLTELARNITSSSLIMVKRMADYNKTFMARLRSLSESVFKAVRELLIEILLVRQLTTPAMVVISKQDCRGDGKQHWLEFLQLPAQIAEINN